MLRISNLLHTLFVVLVLKLLDVAAVKPGAGGGVGYPKDLRATAALAVRASLQHPETASELTSDYEGAQSNC